MIPTYRCRPHTPEADRIELTCRRLQDVVDSLARDLADLDMVLYYIEEGDPRGDEFQLERQRTCTALGVTQTALESVQRLVAEKTEAA